MIRSDSLPRRYNIQNDIDHFYCGKLPNGHQVLMGVQQPELTMVEFDGNGNLIGVSFREIASPHTNNIDIPAKLDEEQIEIQMLNWQKEIEFIPGPISVQQFFLPGHWIGIKDLPDHYQEVLDHPENFDEDRRRVLEEDIRNWRGDGDFVLYWDEEYYLNAEGEVEST